MLWLFVCAAFVLQVHADLDLTVQAANGKVEGTTIETPGGDIFFAWRHIPYAKPPLGELRFKPPEKPEPWEDVLDGSKDSKACLPFVSLEGQPEPKQGYGEDCLYINVYSPVLPSLITNDSLRLPVMFWIYGVGFVAPHSDFSMYDPTPFLDEDVIVVTFNYRIGIFGFLSTEDEVLPGNGGLKDQLAALIWTRENIAYFGGNPLDITLFGEDSGAISVGCHIVGLMSRNLFAGAIMQSGTSLFNLIQTDARQNAVDVANLVDSSITNSSTSDDILEVLQAADADLLVNLTQITIGTTRISSKFGAVLEVDNPRPFMMDPIYESIEAGNITQVPIMIGVNSEESLITIPDIETAQKLALYYDEHPELVLPAMHLKENVSVDTVVEEIKQAYVGNGTFNESIGSFVTMLSDNFLIRVSAKHAVLQSKYTDVYCYEFSFVGTLSKDRPEIPGCGRVAHADEVGYMFNVSTSPIKTEADFLTRKRLVKLWTNFAKTKNPTPDDESAELLQTVTWEPLDEEKLHYLDIGEDLKVKQYPTPEIIEFWDRLWETYSYRPYNTF